MLRLCEPVKSDKTRRRGSSRSYARRVTTTTAFALPSTAGAVRRKRGRPRDPLADGRILRATSELILERGLDQMTVDDVAARAGVGKATVYRRWARKEDLAMAAMEELFSHTLPVPDTGDVRGDLAAAHAMLHGFLATEHGAAYLRTSIAESVRETRLSQLYRRVHASVEALLAEVLRRGVRSGELRADLDVVASVHLLGGAVVIPVITGTPEYADVDGVLELFLRGARA